MAAPAREYIRDPIGTLRGMTALAPLPDRAVRELAERASWLQLGAGETLAAGANDSEHYYFVQDGQVSAVVENDGAHDEGAQVGAKWRRNIAHLILFAPGDVFCDGYRREIVASSPSRIECIAVVESVLFGLPTSLLRKAIAKYPAWGEWLQQGNGALRATFREQKLPARRVAQDFFLSQGLSYATTLKAIDLNRCIHCDACEQACGTRHGVPRLMRRGPTLGRLAFPTACRTCFDHRCVHACGFDSIACDDRGEVVINQRTCVGCTACREACPNGVIEMVETPYTADDFPRPMPATDNFGHTNVDGLYLIGEATGTALIKLAINSGRRGIEHLAERLDPGGGDAGDVIDVAIVGAGPAGLSAALTCRDMDLDFVIFDKGHFATTIANYPKNKLVMAEPAHIPLYGTLWLKNTTKEDLIAEWGKIIDKTGLEIQSNEEVTAVTKDERGLFTVTTAKRTVTTKKVVLAPGTRGSPRKLGVPGEEAPRVQYVLADPEEYAGKRVLVVGGGDSAVEAAMSLADVDGTETTISYRRDSFGRIKAGNRTRLGEYEADGRIEVVLESQVKKVSGKSLTLDSKDGPRRIQNDVVFAMLGAEPPTRFFKRAGIEILEPGSDAMAALAASRGTRKYANKCDHCVDHPEQACVSACPTEALMELRPEQLFSVAEANPDEPRVLDTEPFILGFDAARIARHDRTWIPWVVAASLLATLLVGIEVFLRATMPEYGLWAMLTDASGIGSKDELAFASGRGFGHTLGYIGTALMLAAVLYPLRSRTTLLRRSGSKRLWLTLHMVAGLMGPAFVIYHTALKLDRWPTLAFVGMWLVVVTGALGRYVSTWAAKNTGLVDYELAALDATRARLFDQWSGVSGRTGIFAADANWVALATGVPDRLVVLAPVWLVAHQVSSFARYSWLWTVGLRGVADPVLRGRTLSLFKDNARAVRRKTLINAVDTSVQLWRRIHLWLTVATLAVSAAHIIFALLYKAV